MFANIFQVQKVGQLQAGHLPALPHSLRDSPEVQGPHPPVHVPSGETVQQRHQQPESHLRETHRKEGFRGVRQRTGFPA